MLSGVSKKRKLMISGEISQERHENFDISHLIEKIGVPKLLWGHITNCLDESSCALAVFADSRVSDHVALLALKILHLVGDQSSVGHIEKSLLDIELVDFVAADWVLACPIASHNVILVGSLFS